MIPLIGYWCKAGLAKANLLDIRRASARHEPREYRKHGGSMKEKKIRQKLLSILMAAAMILVQLPVTAFAATAGENSRPGT